MPSTFSESWHRIAQQRISLRPGIKVRRQNYRGERWFVLENPFSNQFYRLRPGAYEFVARLRPDRNVEQAWQECLERFPDEAPGQEAAIQLLAQLYFANLLQYDLPADSAQLFQRYKQRKQREFRSRLLNLMFMRFPLLDPDAFLVRTLPVARALISPLGAIVWFLVVGWALKIVADNFPLLRQQGQAVLAPDNLLLLYAALVVVKTLHEFGHAYFCRAFGGEVHTMGVLLMIFTPVPYMDATSSWGFRSRWRRILVGAAGMIVEAFVAALAAFVWARTSPGTLHNLAYNIMFIASVSTVLFNVNPLLRYDGYYMLSDWLEIPNLTQRSMHLLRFAAERFLFGVKKAENPAGTGQEAFWLATYGVTSAAYRVVVFTAILLFVADRFLLLGIVMAIICAISWVTVPLGRFVHYLASSPRLERTRVRAVLVASTLAALVVAFLQFVPFPHHFRAPGVVEARDWTQVVNPTAGSVRRIAVRPGERVSAGQLLIELTNPELELDLAQTRARYDELQNRLRYAMSADAASLKPLQSLLGSVSNRLDKLGLDQAALLVRARHDAWWVAPGIEDYLGRWLARGSPLGLLIEPSAFQFTATVFQDDVDALFARRIPPAEVRLFGQAAAIVPVMRWRVVPGAQQTLPSAALGWAGGGEIPTSQTDPHGRQAAEPFFEVHADLAHDSSAALVHGRSGKIRFDLESEPLLPRWIRRLLQLLQKRYQI